MLAETLDAKLFEVGDLVQLKSSGPMMTVERVFDDKCASGGAFVNVHCIWFDHESTLCSGKFPAASLRKN